MNIRFLTPKIHGILDYAAAIVLIVAPFVLGLSTVSPLAHWLSVAAGVVLALYSLVTNYSYSIAKIIPFKIHLMLDLAAGLVFVAVPFIFRFDSLATIYCLVLGLGVILVVVLTNPSAERQSVAA